MNKKILIIGLSAAFIFASLFLSAMLVNNTKVPNKNEEGLKPITVKTEVVKNEINRSAISYPGRINAFDNVAIAAEVSGKIMKGNVAFKEGQFFKKGTLLIHIYNKDAQASMKASKSNFLRTLAQILPDMSVDFPESYNNWKQFFNSIDLEKNLPELPKISNDKEKIFLASNGVLSEYYSNVQQEINLSKYNIYAPFNGYFKSVNKEVGSIAGMNADLAVIIRADKLEVTVPVPPDVSKSIIKGSEVILTDGKNEFKAKVSRKAGFVDESTQSVNIYVTYSPKKSDELLEGEYITAIFDTENQTEGIVINREAVSDGQTVFTVKNGKLYKSEITILQELDDQVIISGLQNGDTVVIESLINIEEGQSANIY